jgi:hypothetical protein
VPALSTTRPLVLVCLLTNELLSNSPVDCIGHVNAKDAGAARFSERGLVFSIGRPREKVFAVHFWLRFVTLWFAVAPVGFAESYVLWPFGFASFRWRRGSHRACSLASCAEVLR